MKRLLSIIAIVTVVGLVGCAKTAPAPTPEPEATPAETQSISTEDFESGEAEHAVQGADEAEQPTATGGEEHGETP